MPAGAGGERKYDPSKTDVAEAVYVWLFPNMMLNVYMGQMQTNVVLPVAHDRTVGGVRVVRGESAGRRGDGRRVVAAWSRSATRSRTRTSRSARRCNETFARASTTAADIRRRARTASTISTRCFTSS